MVGWLGEVDYNQLNFKNKKVALFEINWEKIIGLKPAETKYQSLPQHPSIERDIAIEVDWPVKWADIEQFILTPRTRGKDLMIQDVSFLSEYPLENKKSLAFRIVYQADRTLTNGEVEPVEAKIIKLLETKFKAKLRQ